MSDFKKLEIPGCLTVVAGNGGLPKVVIETPWSSAEIYLHGAHVTHFQKKGEAPLLFMSGASGFAPDQAIRGGVPIIFPWFGPREGFPAHGIARTATWDFKEAARSADGAVSLRLRLPTAENFEVEYLLTVSESLSMELAVTNTAAQDATVETCLHTYFQIGAIDRISITGLTGSSYLDKVADSTATETSAAIRIAGEVDRVYSDTAAAVEILDPNLGRRIRIAKSGSNSTVVWNPWIEKSKRMADFGDDEYLQMVCVESGNVGANKITLAPGGCTVLKAVVSSEVLA